MKKYRDVCLQVRKSRKQAVSTNFNEELLKMYNERRKLQSSSASLAGSGKKKDNNPLTRCFDEFNDPDSSDEENNDIEEYEHDSPNFYEEGHDEEMEMPLPTFTYSNNNMKSPETLQKEYLDMAHNPQAIIKKEKV